jgi:hypothetical protein
MSAFAPLVGAKRTSISVVDFMRAASNWRLNLESAHRPGEQKGPSSKTKFTCGQCGQNVWGKPDTAVTCTLRHSDGRQASGRSIVR